MSDSLIGGWGSTAFRRSIATILMSLTGSCFREVVFLFAARAARDRAAQHAINRAHRDGLPLKESDLGRLLFSG